MDIHIVIMAGGVGSRLWPLSTPALPKQFIDLLGIGKTMLQITMERFLPVCQPENIWVVTSENYASLVKEQLPQVPKSQILLEPEPRSTAPCIAYACRKIAIKHPNALVVVTPADAIVLRHERFKDIIQKALIFANEGERIVTIGIKPDRPETGYGYICANEIAENKIVKVSSFKEKPNLQTAQSYLEAGNYFWNAGIFVWSVRTINEQLARFAPQICLMMNRMEEAFYTDKEADMVKKYFPQCEKISIDYAIMEKSNNIYVIAGDLGWNDLGSWSSVGEYIPHTQQTNSIVGKDVRLFECANCIVNVQSAETVVVQGLDGYIIAEKNGNIMICKISEQQRIKEFSK